MRNIINDGVVASAKGAIGKVKGPVYDSRVP